MANDTLDLTSLGPLIEDELNTVVRRLGLGLMTRNIKSSPVDSGRFRSNWVVGFGSQSSSSNLNISSASSSSSRLASELQSFDIRNTKSFHLSNNLPYSERLANGYSTQAPAGWIDLNIRAELKELEAALGA